MNKGSIGLGMNAWCSLKRHGHPHTVFLALDNITHQTLQGAGMGYGSV